MNIAPKPADPSLLGQRSLTVPTLANAVECFDVVAPNAGHTKLPLTCHFPSFSMLVGRAVGTITHGAVRDLDALERLGFHAFSTTVSVAHGYGRFVHVTQRWPGAARERPT